MAITQAASTRITKSFDSICHRLATEAPSTLRMPISLVRCSATNEASPNSPRQLMKIAKTVKNEASFPMRSSASNLAA